jgi:hypothetical protein
MTSNKLNAFKQHDKDSSRKISADKSCEVRSLNQRRFEFWRVTAEIWPQSFKGWDWLILEKHIPGGKKNPAA